jgi:hypothetical protein
MALGNTRLPQSTNNQPVQSNWQCSIRDSTVSGRTSRSAQSGHTASRDHRTYPERHGDQNIDHEQDETLPAETTSEPCDIEKGDLMHLHPVGLAVGQCYGKM